MRWDERIGRRLKLRDLHLLETLARVGSMARAAEELAITQPAISKAIGDVEHTLGIPVLVRNARGVELTPSGAVLVQRGRAIFDEIRQGLKEIEQLADPDAGEVRIGTIEALASFVSEAIERTSRRYPAITFQVTVSDVTTLMRDLEDRALDILIARPTAGSGRNDFAEEVLFHDRLAVVAGRDHPLARRRKITLAEVMTERWVLPPRDSFFGRLVGEAFRSKKVAIPQAAVTSVSTQLRLHLLESGRFLSIQPTTLLHHPDNRARYKELRVGFSSVDRPVAAVTLTRRPMTGAMTRLFESARSAARAISFAA